MLLTDRLTIPEVAKALGISRQRAWYLVARAKRRRLPAQRVGQQWEVTRGDLEAYQRTRSPK